jgi:hypothetical protein
MFGISNHLLVGFLVQFVGMQHLAKGVSQVAVAVVCRLDRASNESRPKAATVETEDTVPLWHAAHRNLQIGARRSLTAALVVTTQRDGDWRARFRC